MHLLCCCLVCGYANLVSAKLETKARHRQWLTRGGTACFEVLEAHVSVSFELFPSRTLYGPATSPQLDTVNPYAQLRLMRPKRVYGAGVKRTGLRHAFCPTKTQ